MKAIQVGLLGFGTVGRGTFEVLRRNQHEIRRRAGCGIEITRIAVRDVERARAALGEAAAGVVLDADPFALVDDPSIEIVIEAIGGTDIARTLVLRALACGKHVVTANKALLAIYGTEIFNAAQAKGVMVAFEAAVAGGIPMIKTLREGLSANRIQWIAGIINGTTNFILSEMRAHRKEFSAALKDAQRLGYAEADPRFDIDGVDAAHKIAMMTAIAFGVPVPFEHIFIEGIRALSLLDIQYAETFGYRIKLLGIARHRVDGIEVRVHPALISARHLLANVEGVMNAVVVHGDAVGSTLYCGAGAGAEPTASAVIADLVDVTRLHTADPEHRVPHLAFRPDHVSDLPILPIDAVYCAYYVRLQIVDTRGVLAEVTTILAQSKISIDALTQKESPERKGMMDLILITHKALEAQMNAALARIEALPTVAAGIVRYRIEALQ